MRLLRTPVLLLVFTSTLLAGCSTPPAVAPSPTPLPAGAIALAPVGSSTARGSMTIGAGASSAVLGLDLSGLQPGALYAAWLHTGTCAQPSASAGHLVSESANKQGNLGASAKTVHTASGALIPLTADLLSDGDYLVAIMDPAGTIVACGQLPKGAH